MRQERRRRTCRYRWTACLVVAGLILVGSVVPTPTAGIGASPLGVVGFDKWIHAFAYAALAGTVARLLAFRRHGSTTVVIGALGVSFLYGTTMELLQLSLPTRHFGVGDLGANAVGVALGVVLWWAGEHRRTLDG